MAQRIDMEHAEKYTKQFPEKCIQDITVTFQDGTKWTKEGLESPGDPGERAFTDEEMLAKFTKLASPVMSAEKVKAASDLILSLDTCENVQALAAALAGES